MSASSDDAVAEFLADPARFRDQSGDALLCPGWNKVDWAIQMDKVAMLMREIYLGDRDHEGYWEACEDLANVLLSATKRHLDESAS